MLFLFDKFQKLQSVLKQRTQSSKTNSREKDLCATQQPNAVSSSASCIHPSFFNAHLLFLPPVERPQPTQTRGEHATSSQHAPRLEIEPATFFPLRHSGLPHVHEALIGPGGWRSTHQNIQCERSTQPFSNLELHLSDDAGADWLTLWLWEGNKKNKKKSWELVPLVFFCPGDVLIAISGSRLYSAAWMNVLV